MAVRTEREGCCGRPQLRAVVEQKAKKAGKRRMISSLHLEGTTEESVVSCWEW